MGAMDKDQILGILAEDYMTPEAIELVARARAMAPRLAARARDAEAAGMVPVETVQEMKEAGLFRVLQVQVGVVRRQRDGAVDGRQRGVGLAGLHLRRGQPAQRLRVVGAFGHQGVGGGQGLGHGATAQGVQNRVVHCGYQRSVKRRL